MRIGPLLALCLALRGGTSDETPGRVRADADRREVERRVLVLPPRAGALPELDALLEAQQDPSSPLFHRWLTPEEFGRRFGATDDELRQIDSWLGARGLHVDEVAKGRGFVTFHGSPEAVAEAFGASSDAPEGDRTRALAAPPELAPLSPGVLSLGRAERAGGTEESTRLRPLVNMAGGHALGPSDFAAIYGLDPLLRQGIDGRGVTIAVVGRSDLQLSDVRDFRSHFALPANDPVITHVGTVPGIVPADELEADIDVQWAGAAAPHARVEFVVSADTATSNGIHLASAHVVEANTAAVLSNSYLNCETSLGAADRAFWYDLWRQAAAQGISVFVASGDSGAAGCDKMDASVGTARAVSGIASTPFAVAVGGTQFVDAADPGRYWSATELDAGHRTAFGYIPEAAWNESGATLHATGGGPSAFYDKPAWQSAPGVPGDGRRDVPDVSLAAAAYDGHVVFMEHDAATGAGVGVVYGTSASTPTMAGVMALVVQVTGERQGNPNPMLYGLARLQAASGAAVFHDVTAGDNDVPGVTGYDAGAGYDLATGLGSPDANALVRAWAALARRRAAPEHASGGSPTRH